MFGGALLNPKDGSEHEVRQEGDKNTDQDDQFGLYNVSQEHHYEARKPKERNDIPQPVGVTG